MFVVKTPVLTEKTFDGIKRNVYVFLVDPKAKKGTIKSQIEYIFNVKVAKVNTLQEPKKSKRIFRNKGYLPRNKRAIVTLQQGYGIQIYPQQNQEVETSEISKTSKLEESLLNQESQNLASDSLETLEEDLQNSLQEEQLKTKNSQNSDNMEKPSKRKRTAKTKEEVDK